MVSNRKLRDKLTVTLSKTLPIADPTKIYRMQVYEKKEMNRQTDLKASLISTIFSMVSCFKSSGAC